MTQSTGLEGVGAPTTRLSHVDGERGELIIAGYPLAELAANATFEQATWLLWHGRRPSPSEIHDFERELAAQRALPHAMESLLRDCAAAKIEPMDALRI